MPQAPPDSTISDAELAWGMPPPPPGQGGRQQGQGMQRHSQVQHQESGYSDSPVRLSLDARLELEHGIKIEHDQQQQQVMQQLPPQQPAVDFSRPPPGFPVMQHQHQQPLVAHLQVQPHPQAAVIPFHHDQSQTQAQVMGGGHLAPMSVGLPAMIPTYDDSTPAVTVKGPPYPGSQEVKFAAEKEQAMVAAQAVASKLQEMQEAKEEERKRKKEKKMAERIAQTEAKSASEKKLSTEVVPSKTSSERILKQVEKQESEMKNSEIANANDSGKKQNGSEKKKKSKEGPHLITLKPFYRPKEKKEKRKRHSEPVVEAEEEEFVPRSPVPLPDKSTIKPVLIDPVERLKIVKDPVPAAGEERKTVKYADGVVPGQGSPDQEETNDQVDKIFWFRLINTTGSGK